MSEDFRIVDRVTRETAAHLQATDAVLAWGDDAVYVLEERDEPDD